jgi:PilZ domain
MSVQYLDQLRSSPMQTSPGDTVRAEVNLRRHRRIAIHCQGRYMRADKAEYPCKLLNVSVGGAAMEASQPVAIGEHVVAYFEEIGRIDGAVVRLIDNGFAMQIQATQHRREKLAAQLTWLANRKVLGIPEARRHDRQMPSKTESFLGLADGQQIPCVILDISISGASVSAELLPPIGMALTLGRLRAKVVRHHDNGVGLQFLDIQNPQALKKHFI